MARRRSALESNFPAPQDFVALASRWRADAIEILLGYIWQGLDRLKAHGFRFDPDQENIERAITQLLAPEIRDAMTGAEPYYLEHSPYEDETRLTANAQPPAYDLGFILRANRRAIWPIEAKVLKTDGGVAEYVEDIRESYLTFRYAPFSSEAAMLGYLLSGLPARALARIAERLETELERQASFPERDHGMTHHTREVPTGKSYPTDFTCHHLIFLIN